MAFQGPSQSALWEHTADRVLWFSFVYPYLIVLHHQVATLSRNVTNSEYEQRPWEMSECTLIPLELHSLFRNIQSIKSAGMKMVIYCDLCMVLIWKEKLVTYIINNNMSNSCIVYLLFCGNGIWFTKSWVMTQKSFILEHTYLKARFWPFYI